MKAGSNQITLTVSNFSCTVQGMSGAYIVVGPSGTSAPYDPPILTVCGSVQFFGVRGSGEHEGYGHTIGALDTALYHSVPEIHSQYIDYLAVDVNAFQDHYPANYVDSVQTGVGGT
jgi:hypothetical protein